MAAGNNYKDWPTLSDATSTSDSGARNERGGNPRRPPIINDSTSCSASTSRKEESKSKPSVLDSSSGMVNSGKSVNSTSSNPSVKKRDRKRGGKTKWSPAPREYNPIEILPYRDTKNERHFNEPNKFSQNSRKNSGREFTNNSANGNESFKGRAFRGGRHGRYSQFRSRHGSAQAADCEKYQRVPQEAGAVILPEESASERERKKLIEAVMTQIQFYFSDDNLRRDHFLRCHMDSDGYVPLSLIASFPKVKQLTVDTQIILQAVEDSLVLDVSGKVWGDVKIRPVVDPLQWCFEEVYRQATLKIFTDGTHYVNLNAVTTQFYNMCVDPPNYQSIPPFKCNVNNAFAYPYILNEDQNKSDALSCPMNEYYDQANSDICNGHASSSDQLILLNSDVASELSSQCISDDYKNKSASLCAENDIPTDVDPDENSGAAANSVFPNRLACSSDQHISSNGDLCSELACKYVPNDYEKKNGAILHPVNRIQPHVDLNDVNAVVSNSNIPTHHDRSSDLSSISEINEYNYFGEISNGVIMYNSGGRYYAAPSNEILVNNSSPSSEDKAALHNKSPEPSR